MLEESAAEPNTNTRQENTTEKQQQTAQEDPNKHPEMNREHTSTSKTQQKPNIVQFPDKIGQPQKTLLNKLQNQKTYPLTKTKTKGGRKKLTFQTCFQHHNKGEFPLSPCVLTSYARDSYYGNRKLEFLK